MVAERILGVKRHASRTTTVAGSCPHPIYGSMIAARFYDFHVVVSAGNPHYSENPAQARPSRMRTREMTIEEMRR